MTAGRHCARSTPEAESAVPAAGRQPLRLGRRFIERQLEHRFGRREQRPPLRLGQGVRHGSLQPQTARPHVVGERPPPARERRSGRPSDRDARRRRSGDLGQSDRRQGSRQSGFAARGACGAGQDRKAKLIVAVGRDQRLSTTPKRRRVAFESAAVWRMSAHKGMGFGDRRCGRTGAWLWSQGAHPGNPGASSVSRRGGGVQHDRDEFHKLSDLARH